MKPTHNSSGPSRNQRGFSLMEVLVAVVVLAIGLLGLAALQTQGLRFNQDAYSRSQATMLAFDIMDRMRANRDALTEYRTYVPDLGTEVCDPLLDPDEPTATYTAVAMDVVCWRHMINDLLPGATATISQLAAPDDDYWQVKMHWVDREPRQFGTARRLPQTEAECEALLKREWVGGKCTVTQIWSFWP